MYTELMWTERGHLQRNRFLVSYSFITTRTSTYFYSSTAIKKKQYNTTKRLWQKQLHRRSWDESWTLVSNFCHCAHEQKWGRRLVSDKKHERTVGMQLDIRHECTHHDRHTYESPNQSPFNTANNCLEIIWSLKTNPKTTVFLITRVQGEKRIIAFPRSS